MAYTVEQHVLNEVTKKVINDMDIEALAKRLAPKITKALEAQILSFVTDSDVLDDYISESKILPIIIKATEINLAKQLGVK